MALFTAARIINSLHSDSINSLLSTISRFSAVRCISVGRKTTHLCVPKSHYTMGALVSCRGNYNVSGNHSSISKTDNSMMSNSRDEIEVTICEENEVPDEGMKAFAVKEVENWKVLIVKTKGEVLAMGNKCTHYGAPLEKGVLCNGKIRCPFHGACFSLKTGDIEDFPGLDSIPNYDVRVVQGQIRIKVNKQQLGVNKVVKKLCKRDETNPEVYVVVGGGAAGQKCVETLRQEGFSGRLVLISAENVLPYDRPKLSKGMHLSPDEVALRNLKYYEDGDIELLFGHSVTGLNSSSKEISLSNGSAIKFDKAFIATGGTPRMLDVPGSDLKGIYYLRTLSDANQIVEASKDKKVVIIGTSFIGMEVAAYLSTDNRSSSVTVIGHSSVPFERSLGLEIGARVQSFFEEKGVTFYNNSTVTKIVGIDGRVNQIEISENVIDADVVIAGIGVVPSTKFLEGSGIELDGKGFIVVNKNLETSLAGLFCGGDIASFPLPIEDNSRVSIGHWQLAHNHGNIAALNMAGDNVPVNTVPFFWTVMFGKSLRYAGYGSYDDIIFNGSLEEMKFVAYYCKRDRVVAVASLVMDPAVACYASYISAGNTLTKEEVLNDGEIAFKLKC